MFLILRLEILTSPFRLLRMTRGDSFAFRLLRMTRGGSFAFCSLIMTKRLGMAGRRFFASLRMTVEGSE